MGPPVPMDLNKSKKLWKFKRKFNIRMLIFVPIIKSVLARSVNSGSAHLNCKGSQGPLILPRASNWKHNILLYQFSHCVKIEPSSLIGTNIIIKATINGGPPYPMNANKEHKSFGILKKVEICLYPLASLKTKGRGGDRAGPSVIGSQVYMKIPNLNLSRRANFHVSSLKRTYITK